MKRFFTMLLTLLLCLASLGNAARAEEAAEPSLIAPFLQFSWQELAQDPQACRDLQPLYGQIICFENHSLSYRLMLGSLKPYALNGSITVDSGVLWELEAVWNALTKALLDEGYSCEAQSFSSDGSRISFGFEKGDTATVMKVINAPGGSRIDFSCHYIGQ